MRDFIVRLSKNQEALSQFESDPRTVLAGVGLSKQDIDILMTRDFDVVRRHISAANAGMEQRSGVPPKKKKAAKKKATKKKK
jgi:hypothetical protein